VTQLPRNKGICTVHRVMVVSDGNVESTSMDEVTG